MSTDSRIVHSQKEYRGKRTRSESKTMTQTQKSTESKRVKSKF